ncbi:hypothetical protein HELRODRAFT_174017 [Helobdella robusta]|uniref:Transcription initiation factor IIB n=1 Tax=Helobdella robusta TaxID=6412 RepID=T1F7H4_HELRO|nr:hypothetical protein HELRODRAFT_174017 [Helobdella robusta]ESO03127.1 hypothetical protein HELRODRAFT_174017 [Helobdella robusta]
MASTKSTKTNVFTLRCDNHPDADLVESSVQMTSWGCHLHGMWAVGAAENELFEGSNISTCITMGSGSSNINEDGKPIYKNRRTMSSGDRVLTIAFKEITQMAERLNIPYAIADRAKTIFRQVQDSKSLKGRSNDTIPSACMYIACRQEGVPRTFKELCAVSKASKRDIGRTFKLIVRIIDTSVDVVSTGDFMSRFCTVLGLASFIQKAAIHIADKAGSLNIVAGRSPVSIAGAAIYMASQASDDKKTANEIGEISGVAETTLKHVYKLMYPRANDLFPEDFKFSVPIGSMPSM